VPSVIHSAGRSCSEKLRRRGRPTRYSIGHTRNESEAHTERPPTSSDIALKPNAAGRIEIGGALVSVTAERFEPEGNRCFLGSTPCR